jgi:hypothetical protein
MKLLSFDVKGAEGGVGIDMSPCPVIFVLDLVQKLGARFGRSGIISEGLPVKTKFGDSIFLCVGCLKGLYFLSSLLYMASRF